MIKKTTAILLLIICLLPIRIFALPDDIVKTRDAIQGQVYDVSMSAANTSSEVQAYITSLIEGLLVGQTRLNDIAITSFTSASAGGEGSAGGFSFVAELRNGGYRMTTDEIFGTINTSRVVVTVASGNSQVEENEPLLLSAEAFEIPKVKYEWYRADNKGDAGIKIDGANKKTYAPDTSGPYTAYFYCVCNGVRSNYVKIDVDPSFKPVKDIQLNIGQIYEGDSVLLSYSILPDNASSKDITWTVYPSTGDAAISDGMLIARKAGNISLVAIVKNGINENTDYAESFSVTIEKKMSAVPPTQRINVDVTELENVKDAYVISVNVSKDKEITFSPISKTERRRLISSSEFDPDRYMTLDAFSTLGGEKGDVYKLTLSEPYSEIVAVTVKNGKTEYVALKPNEGKLTLDSFDSVVLMAEKPFEPAWMLLAVLAVPIVGASVLIGHKNKRRKK